MRTQLGGKRGTEIPGQAPLIAALMCEHVIIDVATVATARAGAWRV